MGMVSRSKLSASEDVRRLLGRGRQGLLSVSSMMAAGRRWLAMSKMRRLSQLKMMTCGRRPRVVSKVEVMEVGVVRRPDEAPRMPNTVFGRTKVNMSLFVKSHSICSHFRAEMKVWVSNSLARFMIINATANPTTDAKNINLDEMTYITIHLALLL